VTGELVIAQVSSWGTVDPRRVATFGGVSEPTPAACGSLTTADACAGAGCFPITGRAVHRLEGGDDACTCSDLTTLLCTADPFEGTPEPSLYLHRWTTPEGTRRELAYQLPVLTDTPPAPFVRCEDAPSTEGCVCLQAPLACP
jgi:hypothetical protein